MGTGNTKIGAWLKEGFSLYKSNFLLLFVVNLVAVLLASVTLGLLTGPLAAGVILVTLGVLDQREPKPEIGDVFKGFSFFLDAFLLVLISIVAHLVIAGIIQLLFRVVMGGLLQLVVSIVINTFVVYGLFLIVDKKMDFWSAVVAVAKVFKSVFLPLTLMVLISGFISGVGALAALIGLLVTMPFFACVNAVVYRDVIREQTNAA